MRIRRRGVTTAMLLHEQNCKGALDDDRRSDWKVSAMLDGQELALTKLGPEMRMVAPLLVAIRGGQHGGRFRCLTSNAKVIAAKGPQCQQCPGRPGAGSLTTFLHHRCGYGPRHNDTITTKHHGSELLPM
jgi:hypothetical protein